MICNMLKILMTKKSYFNNTQFIVMHSYVTGLTGTRSVPKSNNKYVKQAAVYVVHDMAIPMISRFNALVLLAKTCVTSSR